jgi:hypothetical protein
MANSILIIGPSGTGKSTSVENLDPKETFIIKVKDKPLPFRGCNKKYKLATKDNPEGNMIVIKSEDPSNRHAELKACLKRINDGRPEIKTIIIDDFQYLMVDEYMSRCQESGYGKFAEMGANMWKIFDGLSLYRNDLNIIILSHSQIDDDGISTIKLIGKMVRNTVAPEGIFTVMLHTVVSDNKYKFLTQFRTVAGRELQAKSPKDMFDDDFIDNDLQLVIDKMNEYYDFEDVPQ